MRLYLILFGLISMGLLYALTVATRNDSQLTDYFWWMIAACGLLIALLLVMLLRYTWLLFRNSRHNMLGSRITRRLAFMFTLVAVLPSLFLFGVSAQFISYSINSWFGNDTAQALDSSLDLSKSALNLALDNSVRRAKAIQAEMIGADALQQDMTGILQQSERKKGFNQLSVYNLQTHQILNSYNPARLPAPQLDPETRASLLHHQQTKGVENINGTLYAQGWLLLPTVQQQAQALFFRQAIPANVARDATLIEAARSKYAELSYAQQGLQTFFLITLLAATLLAIMLALVIALYFARRFLEPILSLAEGAKAVAQGDFSQRRPIYRQDELGHLTELFNHMTEQLSIAQQASEQNRLQQEAARHYLETVLNSITAGVVTLDEQGCLNTYNHSAETILGVPLANLLGSNWHHWAQQTPQNALLAELFQAILDTRDDEQTIQTTYSGSDEARILLAKAMPLPEDNGKGTVLVFDDVTALVHAQKEAAWGEVAKRLAHEIRNPLTPIQLSAERLAWKLQDKLNEQDAQILMRSTDTIVKQVAAMKEMVEAFRNYARAPALKLTKLNLNQIIEEVLLLYESSSCTFTANLSNITLFISADAGAMRQVLHNILKNAAEAAESDASPEVHIITQQQGDHALLTVYNNGKNFSKDMLLHAFEPYVTDKATGTGLGLPVVKKIIEEHGGRINLSNPNTGGACVKITLPLLAEQNEK